MSIETKELIRILDEIAPLSDQEEWDNSGIQIDMGRMEVNRILVCLEITREVVEEAISEDVDFIVTHHPLIFHGLRKIDKNDVTGSNLLDLIFTGISVYSSHTCFDSTRGGNNDDLATRLQLHRISRLAIPGQVYKAQSMATQGYLDTPMRLADFAIYLDDVLEHPGGIKVSGDPDRVIKKVGLCTGAGGEFAYAAAAAGCDVFISGDVKHHEAQAAKEQGMCMIDAGHFGTEFIFTENMAKKLRNRSGGAVEILQSQVNVNPYDFVL